MQELGWNLIGKGAAAQARPKIRGTAAVDGILDVTDRAQLTSWRRNGSRHQRELVGEK